MDKERKLIHLNFIPFLVLYLHLSHSIKKIQLHYHYHLNPRPFNSHFHFCLLVTMTSIGKLGAMQQLMKGGKMMPANVISDDSILVKKIVSDHNPEGLDYDVKPLLNIVEDILRRSTLTSSEHSSVVYHSNV